MYKEPPIKCVNSFVLIIFFAAISIFHDLIILMLPLPILWGLKLHWKKKAHAIVMFSVGAFVIICSALRLPILFAMKHTMDPSCKFLTLIRFHLILIANSDDQAPVALWSYLEQAVGIICGCLPAFRSLLSFMFPKLRVYLGTMGDNGPNSASYGSTNKSFRSRADKYPSRYNGADIELGKKGTSQEQIVYGGDRTSDESDHFRLVPADTNGDKLGTQSTVTADERNNGIAFPKCPKKARRNSKSEINVTQTVHVMK
jgi:hypothetical protein